MSPEPVTLNQTSSRFKTGILILLPAFFVLASVRNDFGIVLASALFALSGVLTQAPIGEKMERFLEHFTAKTGCTLDTVKMQPNKPGSGFVYMYVLHFVTYVVLLEVVLRAIGWIG